MKRTNRKRKYGLVTVYEDDDRYIIRLRVQ